MAIQVTCPGCLKRFSVSDKFAGKTGPCPSCSKQIKIPDKSDEVVIHAPEDKGPKDSKGRSVLKPIRRSEVKLSTPIIVAAIAVPLILIVVAVGIGINKIELATPVLAVTSCLLAFPLALAGYWFLRDDELEGFQGRELLVRCLICALVFPITWALYAFIPAYLYEYTSMAENSAIDMAMFIGLMLVVGSIAAVLLFELEVLNGVLHYGLFFVVTFVLAWIAGVPLGKPLTGDSSSQPEVPAATQPNQPAPQPGASPPVPPKQGNVPNLMQ